MMDLRGTSLMARRYLATLALVVLTSLFVMTIKAPDMQARTWPESCPRLMGTFNQPLAVHATWMVSDWSALMWELHAVAGETLYPKWTWLDQFNIFEEGSGSIWPIPSSFALFRLPQNSRSASGWA